MEISALEILSSTFSSAFVMGTTVDEFLIVKYVNVKKIAPTAPAMIAVHCNIFRILVAPSKLKKTFFFIKLNFR